MEMKHKKSAFRLCDKYAKKILKTNKVTIPHSYVLYPVLTPTIGTPGPFLGLWQKRKGGGGGSWKGTIWEGGHRVPGIVSLPGKIKPAISDALVSSMDIFPTVVKLADAKMPSDRHFDGMDISDVLFEGQNEAHEVCCSCHSCLDSN